MLPGPAKSLGIGGRPLSVLGPTKGFMESSVMGSPYMGPSLNNDSLSHFWGSFSWGLRVWSSGLEFGLGSIFEGGCGFRVQGLASRF